MPPDPLPPGIGPVPGARGFSFEDGSGDTARPHRAGGIAWTWPWTDESHRFHEKERIGRRGAARIFWSMERRPAQPEGVER